MVAQQYLWCAERARWVCLAVVAGLAVNVGLNLVLLPRLGLHGAVLAAAAANAVALTLVVLISRGLGFQGDRGLWVVLATPAFLALGWPAAVAALLVLALDGWQGRVVLDADQRQQLCDGAAEYLGRLRKLWNKQPR
jgi:O-antigen/teichoic acid export membrane protein